MPETIMWVTAAVMFLVGMAAGIRLQELGTRQRERTIAAERRELAARAQRRARRQVPGDENLIDIGQ